MRVYTITGIFYGLQTTAKLGRIWGINMEKVIYGLFAILATEYVLRELIGMGIYCDRFANKQKSKKCIAKVKEKKITQ